MDPDLVKIFAEKYIAERNRLEASHVDDRAVKEKELAKVIRDQGTLVNALLAGTPPERVNARMEQLAARQKQPEAELAAAPPPAATVRIHPAMADTYHSRIRALIAQISEPDARGEAREEIRSLVEKITVTPMPTGGKRMKPQLHLHGALAGILALSLGLKETSGQQKTSCEQEVTESIAFLVAGKRNRRNLPRLKCMI